jgi:hypothetical protein
VPGVSKRKSSRNDCWVSPKVKLSTIVQRQRGAKSEDTVMEPKDRISGVIHMRERNSIMEKVRSFGLEANHTAYEAHRECFGSNFWSLVEIYSRRELSFEEDIIRAFVSVLRSVETEYGPAIWGIPAFEFVRGLTWSHSRHDLSLRRESFSSWSWVGWRGNTDVRLQFENCKRTEADLAISYGRCRVSMEKLTVPSTLHIDWWYCTRDQR